MKNFYFSKRGKTMKINSNAIHKVYQSQTKQSTQPKEINSVQKTDKIEVSAQAKQELSLHKIKSEILTSLDQDNSKNRVNELKALIKSGQYEIKHRDVAEAIIAYSEILSGNNDE